MKRRKRAKVAERNAKKEATDSGAAQLSRLVTSYRTNILQAQLKYFKLALQQQIEKMRYCLSTQGFFIIPKAIPVIEVEKVEIIHNIPQPLETIFHDLDTRNEGQALRKMGHYTTEDECQIFVQSAPLFASFLSTYLQFMKLQFRVTPKQITIIQSLEGLTDNQEGHADSKYMDNLSVFVALENNTQLDVWPGDFATSNEQSSASSSSPAPSSSSSPSSSSLSSSSSPPTDLISSSSHITTQKAPTRFIYHTGDIVMMRGDLIHAGAPLYNPKMKQDRLFLYLERKGQETANETQQMLDEYVQYRNAKAVPKSMDMLLFQKTVLSKQEVVGSSKFAACKLKCQVCGKLNKDISKLESSK